MKQIQPRTLRNGKQGYWILQIDTADRSEVWQPITAEEWEWVQAAAPDLHGIRRRFVEVAARYGLRHDPTPPRTKCLWE